MDALTYIVAFMAAIVALWVGYFIGNFYPVLGKAKKIKESKESLGKSSPVFDSLNRAGKRVINWLLEREEDPGTNQKSASDSAFPEEVVAASQPETPSSIGVIDAPEGIGLGALVLWHDRRKKKLVAQIEGEIVDLDGEVTGEQHGDLSMLLVDLQERVGLPATLRDAIAAGTDKVMAEKQRQRVLPKKEEQVKPPSFNPLKSIVNYVQADIPKIDSTASIPDQINGILQEMIAGTPLEKRGISMAEWPNRGAVFIVGVEVYEDIHKIPDPEVRVAIRDAVKRWELTQDDG
ncbi:MAG: hypothetical protein JW757_13885 [Anaerolineales bacterium]|nr:hypothetical protein [Anaerolineales bacterium]